MSILGAPALTGLKNFEGSGPIVSLTDGAGNPLKSLTAHIEPVQDLHGYDNPWPAGGGKNKLDYTVAWGGVSYNAAVGTVFTLVEPSSQPTVSGDTVTFTTASAWAGRAWKTPILASGSYTVHLDVSQTTNSRMSIYTVDGSTNTVKTVYASTSSSVFSRTVTIDTGDYIIVSEASSTAGTITVKGMQVESGESYTGWIPYSNICPISGWTGTNIWRTGKNLFDADTVFASFKQTDGSFKGGLNSVNQVRPNIPSALVGSTLTFSASLSIGTSTTSGIRLRVNVGDTYQYSDFVTTLAYSRVSVNFTPTSANDWVNITYSTGGTGQIQFKDIQLELGSTATAYEPYSGDTYPISWETEAGTVYGGTLDVTTGVLTVDKLYTLIDENTSIDQRNSGVFYVNLSSSYRKMRFGGARAMCDILKISNTSGYDTCENGYICLMNYSGSETSTYVGWRVSDDIDTVEKMTAWLENNNIQIVTNLATPVIYQLTPQQINTLIGENNIWADTGDVDVEYSKRSFSFLSSMISSPAKHYTVRWDKENSQMVRLNDAKKITIDTANFKHSGSVNPNYNNPFDKIYPWSGRKLCNISLNSYMALQSGDNIKDCVTYWENQTGFSYDDTDGVWVYTPEFWGKSWDDGTYRYFDVADQPVNGYRHYPEMITARWRGVRESRTIGGTAQNIILPKPGLPITRTALSTIHTYANNGGMTLDSVYTLDASLLLYLVEYANYNAQSAIGNGVSDLYDQTTLHPDAAVTAGTTVQFTGLTSAQLADFIEGTIVDFGTASGGAQTAKTYITAVETTSGVTTVTLADAVTITTDTFVSIHGRINCADADIGSMSGYIGTNSKSDAYYRGEALWGNMYYYTLGAYKSATEHVWLAAEGTEDNYDEINTSVHMDTGIVLAGSAGYIKTLAFPDSLGTLFACALCTEVPGTSAAPVGDYFGTSAGNNRVLLVGGGANSGANDGPFYWYWRIPAGSSDWVCSGRPLLKSP